MIKCNLCGKEFEGGRQVHQHMNVCHHEEYQEVDFDLEQITTGYERKKARVYNSKEKDKPAAETSDRPKKLRPLNKAVPEEMEVYRLGYRWYDPETGLAFTVDEMRSEGWI